VITRGSAERLDLKVGDSDNGIALTIVFEIDLQAKGLFDWFVD